MCDHPTIVRVPVGGGDGFMWNCTEDDCRTNFFPIEAMMQVEQKSEEVLDSVTAVFSAVLWDLHERAFETHGIPHGQGSELEATVCEETGHIRDPKTNVCTRCGDNPFLGG